MITFSIITPVHDPPIDVLRQTVESVLAQSYPHWELCMVDDGSRSPRVLEVLLEYAAADSRIKVARREQSGGISRATNEALAMATGEFVAFLDHDDLIVRGALASVNREIEARDGQVDYCYSDEAVLAEDGFLGRAFYKPDWSPERLRSHMYTCHFSVMRRTLVAELGGLRHEFDGSQDYDLVLRLVERTDRIVHVPEVLYLWRVLSGSAAGDNEAKPYALDAARRAVQDHCDRTGIDGVVETTLPGHHRVCRRLQGRPLVSIIIPTRGTRGRVDGEDRVHVVHAVTSILDRSTYEHLEVVVVADEVTPEPVVHELRGLLGDRLRLVWSGGPFNFARKMNSGVAASSGEFLLLLNDDVEVVTPDWIETLVSHVQVDDCGMAGCKLVLADGTLQHGGHVYAGGVPHHACYGFPEEYGGMAQLLRVERECAGVTAACAAIRREVWDRVGGMAEELPMNYNDVDLSLKLRHLGLRIIWTPHAVLRHFESMTRPTGSHQWEFDWLNQRWGTEALRHDPYFNPNLDQTRNDWVIVTPAEAWL